MSNDKNPPKTNNDKLEFHLHEFDALREEIMTHYEQSWNVGMQTVLASGAIFAWLATNGDKIGKYHAVWWLPCGLALLGAIRTVGLWRAILFCAAYISKIEAAYADKPRGLFGWEAFRTKEQEGLKGRYDTIWITSVLFYVLFAAACIVVPLLAGKK